MRVQISVTGHEQIDRVLKALPLNVSHPILQAAHAKAAVPLVHREHLLAPVGKTGNLAESIGVVKSPFKRSGTVGEVNVGPRRGGRYKGHHGHLSEFGTKKRQTRKGANRGVMPKRVYAKPSFDQTHAKVVSNIAGELARSLDRTMRRYIKR